MNDQWRRRQVKSWGYISRRLNGWGLDRVSALPSWGSWGLPPQKKINFAPKKICNSDQVLILISYTTAESGGLSPRSGSTKKKHLGACPPKFSLPSPFLYPFPFHSPIFGGLANIWGPVPHRPQCRTASVSPSPESGDLSRAPPPFPLLRRLCL